MEPLSILIVCTANRCRSPMAEVMLADQTRRNRLPFAIASAGMEATDGMPATSDAVAAMAARGLDLGGHRSRALTTELAGAAHLILTMERRHVRAIAVNNPTAFARTFTLREFVRRAGHVGPLGTSAFSDWLGYVRTGRRPSDLLGADPLDDIADPIGLSRKHYEQAAECLATLLRELVFLLSVGRA